MPAQSAQAGRVLPAQDLRNAAVGVRHDHIGRILGPAETTDLRGVLPEERKAPRAVSIQRDATEANSVLPVHETKGVQVGTRKQTVGG